MIVDSMVLQFRTSLNYPFQHLLHYTVEAWMSFSTSLWFTSYSNSIGAYAAIVDINIIDCNRQRSCIEQVLLRVSML